MEFEQITKRLEWLDDQERKSKASLAEMEKRLAALETTISAVSKQFKTLSRDVSELAPAPARLDQFDQILSKQRVETSRALEEIEKNAQRREREAALQRQAELSEVNAAISDLRRTADLEPLRKQLRDLTLEDKRQAVTMQDTQQKMDAALKQIEAALNI